MKAKIKPSCGFLSYPSGMIELFTQIGQFIHQDIKYHWVMGQRFGKGWKVSKSSLERFMKELLG